MNHLLTSLRTDLHDRIWKTDLAALPGWQAWGLRMVRVLYAVVRDLSDGQLTLRAMSLVYTTLLSLVPLLAVSFSVLKGFGVHNQIEPLLLNFLEPLGEQGVEIAGEIVGFVENIRVGVLGAVGLGLLLYTVVSLIQKIERAFNYTWRITNYRRLAQRFSDYLSVILVGPVLVFSAVGVTASLASNEVVNSLIAIQPFGYLLQALGKLLPYVLIITAFTFIYIFIPNTRVRLSSAITGAVVSGFLWKSTGWAFASFAAGSTKYTAIYSGLAILIMFMIWLYLSWMILLLGASIAFYHQHPEHLLSRRQDLRLSGRMREKLALLAVLRIGENFYHNRPPWERDALALELAVPVEALDRILEALEESGLLARVIDEEPGYLPSQALENISVKKVLDAVRQADENPCLNPDELASDKRIDDLLGEIDSAVGTALQDRSIRSLIKAESSRAEGG